MEEDDQLGQDDGGDSDDAAASAPLSARNGTVPWSVRFSEERLAEQIQELKSLAAKPEEFFQPDEERAAALTALLRFFFEYSKRTEGDRGAFRKPMGPLHSLHTDGIDVDSIWAQVQLRNAPLLRGLKGQIARLSASDDISLAAELPVSGGPEQEDDSDADAASESERRGQRHGGDSDDEEAMLAAALDAQENGAGGGDSADDDEIDDELDSDGGGGRKKPAAQRKRVSRAERDGFFDYDDMDQFADETMAQDDDGLEEAVLEELYGAGTEADGEGATATFGDLFAGDDYAERGDSADEEEEEEDEGEGSGAEEGEGEDAMEEDGSAGGSDAGGGGGGSGESGGEGSDGEDAARTPHEQAQRRMRGKIDELEAELLRERPWALRGEVAAKDRPENSLLEAALDVERATRVAPAITVEATASLEDVIRQRILEDKFDDVAPKNIELSAKPREDAPEVSMDKSTEGLAAVYEKEYLKQALGVEEDDPSRDLKEELRRDFARLCGKLDALCNFHFRPRAHLPEVAVATDVPAIAMEEALPTGVSTADGLAPEEVYARKRGRGAVFLEGGAEMDQDERNRARLAKKRLRNKARKQTEAEQKLVSRANPGLGNPYEQRKLLADIRGARNVTEGAADARTGKDFSTSTKFFGALQKQVAKGVKDAAAAAAAGADGGGSGTEKRSNRGAALRL